MFRRQTIAGGTGGTGSALAVLVVVGAGLVNVVWALTDRSVFAWDQALYAKATVDLFRILLTSPSAWPDAMLRVFGSRAPAIAWLGQFFVPIGVAAGSIDFALLL